MPTLSELAKTQQTTTVGQAQNVSAQNVGGTSIQADKQIDNSAGLATDIGKMFGGIMKEHQQASEYAGKRVGTDNLVEYKKEMGAISNYYAGKTDLKSSDMAEKTRLEQGVYETYIQRGHFGDNELANQSFKDTYASPAYDDLMGNRERNSAIGSKLFTNEEIMSVKEEMTISHGAYTVDNVRTWQERIKAVGQDPQLIWEETAVGLNSTFTDMFKDGISSPSLALYLDEDGKLTQAGLDKLFNDNYGNFAKRTEGVFSKNHEDMGEKSYDSMKKSFNGWIASLENDDPIKVMQTVGITNSSIKSTDASSSISAKKSSALKQVADLYAVLNSNSSATTISQYTKARQALQEIEIKEKQSYAYESRFNSFIAGNYSQLGDAEYTYDIYNPNLSRTSGGGTISANDMSKYIGEKTFNTYNQAVRDGNTELASSSLYALGRLEMLGNTTPQSKQVANVISSLDKFGMRADTMNNIGQFESYLRSSVGYKNVTRQDSPHLTKRIVDSTMNYYNDQKALMEAGGTDENGKALTEGSILNNTKLFYRVEARTVSSALRENQRIRAGALLGMSREDSMGDEMDRVVSGEILGYKVGTSEFANGTLDSVVSEGISNGMSNRSSLENYMKNKMTILDKSYFFVGGTSLVVANPTTLSADKFRNNISDLITYNVGQFQSAKNIDISADVVDDKNVDISQSRVYNGSSDTNELITIVNIKSDSGKILHSVLMTPEDIQNGVPSALKKKFSDKFEEADKKDNNIDILSNMY